MSSSQLRPLRKLVLAAGRVQLRPDLEVFFLDFPLLGGGLGCRDGEVVYRRPKLWQKRRLVHRPLPSKTRAICGRVRSKKKRTKSLMALAPTVLTMRATTSTTRTRSRTEGIILGVDVRVDCGVSKLPVLSVTQIFRIMPTTRGW